MSNAGTAAACMAVTLAAILVTSCGGGEGVERFASLPVGYPGHIEGLTADTDGNIYAASLEIPGLTPLLPSQEAKKDEFPSPNFIYVWDARGRLAVSMPMPAGPHASHPWRVPAGILAVDRTLYVIDLLNGDILEYRLPLSQTSQPSAVHEVCGGLIVRLGVTEAGHFCTMNDLALGPDGNIYASDTGSAALPAGRIIKLDRATGAISIFLGAPLDRGQGSEVALDVDPEGFPRFGANGIAFGPPGFGGAATERFLFVANMSTARIWKIPLALEGAQLRITGPATLFAEDPAIDGPDDMVFDSKGRLWVVSGQENQAVRLDSSGKVAQKVGKFDGVKDGMPKELLQPSSIVFSKGYLYLGNEASRNFLPENFPVNWDDLETFTVSRFKP